MPRVIVARREWAWAALWSSAIVAVTLIPYVYASVSAPPGAVFGGLLINARDGNSYLAKMRAGFDGDWLFRLPFTSEEQRGVFMFTFYLGLGHLARILGLSLPTLFHAARLLCGWLLLMTVYRFGAELTPDPARRRWAFWLVALSSGLGWLAAAFGREAVDLAVPEAITFYALLSSPHFPLSMALMLAGLLAAYRPLPFDGLRTLRRPTWAAPAGCGLALALVAPYALPAALGALAGLSALSYLRLRKWDGGLTLRSAAFAGGALPVLAYDALSLLTDPAVKAWAAQNITPSPPPLDYLLGYGLLAPLAAAGAWRAWKEHNRFGWLLIAWVLATAALLYSPVALQRRFVTGLHLPLAMLAAMGMPAGVARSGAGRRRPALIAAALALTLPTNILLMAALFHAPKSGDPYVYRSQAEWEAMIWLGQNTAPEAVALAGPVIGNFIPAVAGRRVVYGHPFETIEAQKKEAEVVAFFAGALSPAEAQRMLEAYRVAYVFVGPLERGLAEPGLDWDRLAEDLGLRLVYSRGDVAVYERPLESWSLEPAGNCSAWIAKSTPGRRIWQSGGSEL